MGQEFPEQPKLTARQNSALSAFYYIGEQRRVDQGIPYRVRDDEVLLHSSIHGCYGYERKFFLYVITSIDQEYITRQHKDIKKQADKAKAEAARKRS